MPVTCLVDWDTCCDRSVVHVLQLGSDEFVLLQCCCYLLLLYVFVNCFVACIAVVSRGVMIGMSGESWRHKYFTHHS